MAQILREFIITLKDKNDLDQFYLDMESTGGTGCIPKRAVECLHRRPISRNTHYQLSQAEVDILKKDPRVENITLTLKDKGITRTLNGSQTGTWSRGAAIAVDQKNWALYRSSLEDNIAGWGSDGADVNKSATVTFTGTGKNVDVVVLDENAYAAHSEFGNRYQQYNWFQHNSTVWPGNPSTTYSYAGVNQTNNHATLVSAIIAGNTQGWAREANIYNLRHDTVGFVSNPGPLDPLTGTYIPSQYVIDYVRAFHSSKSTNPATGRKNPTIVNCSWSLGTSAARTNSYTTNLRMSKINFRGSFATPVGTVQDTGVSGVCGSGTRVGVLPNLINGGNRMVTTSNTAAATMSSLSKVILGSSGMTDLGNPTHSDNTGQDIYDDAYWTLTLPFQISYCGVAYGGGGPGGDLMHISSNSFVQFGGAASTASAYDVGYGAPAVRKILISAGDRSCQRLWSSTTGTTPNRKFRIRWEGTSDPVGGTIGNPTTVWEMTFYESAGSGSGVTNSTIDLHIDTNACYRGEFTASDAPTYGVMQNGYAPYRDATLDADISDAIADGIIFVSSAGDSAYKMDLPTGQDYNNYFVDKGDIFYYHRGATPNSSHTSMICVGTLDSNSVENKEITSNTGPRVDLYAPGKNIISAVYDGSIKSPPDIVNDGSAVITSMSSVARTSNVATITTSANHGLTTGAVVTITECSTSSFNTTMATITVTGVRAFTYANTGITVATTSATGTITPGYFFQKATGSSYAAAQVTGILAIALETYPKMTQAEAKAYILNYTKANKMYASNGSFTDAVSLQGGNNKMLYYYKERPADGAVFPKINYKIRPSLGMVFPRTQIRKTKP